MNKLIILFLGLFVLISCSKDKPAKQGIAPSLLSGAYSLEIVPIDATRKSTLRLQAKGFDLASGKIGWEINGIPFTTLSPSQFDGTDASKGDRVQARTIINGVEVVSNTVTIGNSAPEIKRVALVPEVFKPGDKLSVDVESNDADGDEVALLYKWSKNGSPAGEGKSIEGDLKRGDKLSLQITPFDGEAYGRAFSLSREIANLPPIIEGHKEFTLNGSVYTYQVRASDPDGDALTYSIGTAENGMTIDPATGLLKWNVPSDFKGGKNVSITVSDGHGGTASYTITINIQ